MGNYIEQLKIQDAVYDLSAKAGSGLTKDTNSGALSVKVGDGLEIVNGQVCSSDWKILKKNFEDSGATVFNDINDVLTTLDMMHGTNGPASDKYNGNFKAYIINRKLPVEITSQAKGYVSDAWVQEIKTDLKLNLVRLSGTTDVVNMSGSTVHINMSGTTNQKYLHVVYKQEFIDPIQYTKGENIYYRTHNVATGWSKWYRKNGEYANNPLENKNLLIIGGSFAYNWRGYGNSPNTSSADGLEFKDENGKTRNMMDYIANKLNLNSFGNFGEQGQGVCDQNRENGNPYFSGNSIVQVTTAKQFAADNKFNWDAAIVLGGINDYQIQSGNTALNEKSWLNDGGKDYSKSHTYYSCLRYINQQLITNSTYLPSLYYISPYRPLISPYNDVDNEVESQEVIPFKKFLQTFEQVSKKDSIPYLDLFNKCVYNDYLVKFMIKDKVHPNGWGYYASANIIINFLINEAAGYILLSNVK